MTTLRFLICKNCILLIFYIVLSAIIILNLCMLLRKMVPNIT